MVGNQIIWNNSFIRIDNTVVMYTALFKKNVLYIRDLFDQLGNPFSYNSFKIKYQIERFPFSLYFGLIDCIPIGWRRAGCVSNNGDDDNDNWFKTVMNIKSASQFIYSKIIYQKANFNS